MVLLGALSGSSPSPSTTKLSLNRSLFFHSPGSFSSPISLSSPPLITSSLCSLSLSRSLSISLYSLPREREQREIRGEKDLGGLEKRKIDGERACLYLEMENCRLETPGRTTRGKFSSFVVDRREVRLPSSSSQRRRGDDDEVAERTTSERIWGNFFPRPGEYGFFYF